MTRLSDGHHVWERATVATVSAGLGGPLRRRPLMHARRSRSAGVALLLGAALVLAPTLLGEEAGAVGTVQVQLPQPLCHAPASGHRACDA